MHRDDIKRYLLFIFCSLQMLHNDHLLCNVSRTLAANDYYNTKMAQHQYLSNGRPTLPSSLFNLGITPSTTQQGMSQPQIYGYNYNDKADSRIAQTLSDITQNASNQTTVPAVPLYQQSQVISSLMNDGTANVKPKPFLNTPTDALTAQQQQALTTYTTSPQPTQTPAIPTVQGEPKESFTVVPDGVIISRTTIAILVLIIVLFIIVRLWFRQQKLELMLALKYYKESKDINDKAVVNAF